MKFLKVNHIHTWLWMCRLQRRLGQLPSRIRALCMRRERLPAVLGRDLFPRRRSLLQLLSSWLILKQCRRSFLHPVPGWHRLPDPRSPEPSCLPDVLGRPIFGSRLNTVHALSARHLLSARDWANLHTVPGGNCVADRGGNLLSCVPGMFPGPVCAARLHFMHLLSVRHLQQQLDGLGHLYPVPRRDFLGNHTWSFNMSAVQSWSVLQSWLGNMHQLSNWHVQRRQQRVCHLHPVPCRDFFGNHTWSFNMSAVQPWSVLNSWLGNMQQLSSWHIQRWQQRVRHLYPVPCRHCIADRRRHLPSSVRGMRSGAVRGCRFHFMQQMWLGDLLRR